MLLRAKSLPYSDSPKFAGVFFQGVEWLIEQGLQDNSGLAAFTYRLTGRAVSSDDWLCFTAVTLISNVSTLFFYFVKYYPSSSPGDGGSLKFHL